MESVHSKSQLEIFGEFINSWSNKDINLLYNKSFGKFHCVYVYVDCYVIEIVYINTIEKNEIRTLFYINVNESLKQFVLKKKLCDIRFQNLQRFRRDYYVQSVTDENWADNFIKTIKSIEENKILFLQICDSSCPFYKDGSHKFKSWKTFAKVEISYEENTGVAQGYKNGEEPFGSHVVGGNGSFRYWEKGNYVIKYTVDKMAYEKPIKWTFSVDADSFLRELLSRLGRTKMPYKMFNSKLTNKIEVITYEMDKDPDERVFYPVEYNNNWIEYIKQALYEFK